LKEIIKRHNGKIGTSIQKSTHVVEQDPEDNETVEDDTEYLRTIEKKRR